MKDELVNQPTSTPTAKVGAVAVAGTTLTIIIGLLNVFGISVPADVSGAALTAVAALVTVTTFVAGYFKKEKKANV